MKFKTPVFSELRGRLGHQIESNTVCFRTYKTFGIQVIKNPARKVDPAGSQWLYRHQLYYLSLHWNFLTPEQKAAYDVLGGAAGISGYDYYIKEKHDIDHLYLAPTDNLWAEEYKPDRNPTAEEGLHLSDYDIWEDYAHINFPLEQIPSNLLISKAELWLRYAGEAGSSAEGKRVDCHKITEPWAERTITWNNRPSVSATETDHIDMPAERQWFSFTVTQDINDLISGGSLFYGWRVKYHSTVTTSESYSYIRATYPHKDDFWPYLKLEL